jgi:uncharacterized protein
VKRILIIILGVWSVISYAQETINPDGYNVFYYPGGQKSSEGNLREGKPDGFWITYYPSGMKKSEGKRNNFLLDSLWNFYNQFGDTTEKISYLMGKKNGYSLTYSYNKTVNSDKRGVLISKELYVNDNREGRSYYFTNNGKLKEIVNYREGKRNGISLEFARDSLVTAYRMFVNDIMVENERVNRNDTNKWRQGVWKDFFEDGRLKKEAYYRNDTLDGLYKEFNEKGNLIVSMIYEKGKIKEYAASDEESIEMKNEYDDLGNLLYSGPFKKGKAIGVHRWYDGKGAVVSSRQYDDNGILIGSGIIDDQGRKQGNWEYYYESAEVKGKGRYTNNQKTGKWIYFYKNGKLMQEGTFKGDLPEGTWKWYYPDAALLREEEYLAGKEDGTMAEYNQLGEIITQGDFVEGEKEGKWIYKVGDHSEEGNFITGLRDGIWKYFYGNGNIEFEGNYIQGNADGKHKYFYETGELMEERIFSMGLREKTWKKYDKVGNVILSITYQDDAEVKINGVKIDLPLPDKKIIK